MQQHPSRSQTIPLTHGHKIHEKLTCLLECFCPPFSFVQTRSCSLATLYSLLQVSLTRQPSCFRGASPAENDTYTYIYIYIGYLWMFAKHTDIRLICKFDCLFHVVCPLENRLASCIFGLEHVHFDKLQLSSQNSKPPATACWICSNISCLTGMNLLSDYRSQHWQACIICNWFQRSASLQNWLKGKYMKEQTLILHIALHNGESTCRVKLCNSESRSCDAIFLRKPNTNRKHNFGHRVRNLSKTSFKSRDLVKSFHCFFWCEWH